TVNFLGLKHICHQLYVTRFRFKVRQAKYQLIAKFLLVPPGINLVNTIGMNWAKLHHNELIFTSSL
ncbi:5387_t:CDS:1, partial [Funneliformis geosporum]